MHCLKQDELDGLKMLTSYHNDYGWNWILSISISYFMVRILF